MHPLIQLDWSALEALQLGDGTVNDIVNSSLVLQEIGRLINRANHAALNSVPPHIPFREKVECVGKVRVEVPVNARFAQAGGHCESQS